MAPVGPSGWARRSASGALAGTVQGDHLRERVFDRQPRGESTTAAAKGRARMVVPILFRYGTWPGRLRQIRHDYECTENFASPGGALLDMTRVYAAPARLGLNHWALWGTWTVESRASVLNQANGRIACRFHARDLHLVMGSAAWGNPLRFRVLIDGQPPGAAHGIDVDDQGKGTVTEPRLYQLIHQPKPIADRQFEIEFLDSAWRPMRSPSADPRPPSYETPPEGDRHGIPRRVQGQRSGRDSRV